MVTAFRGVRELVDLLLRHWTYDRDMVGGCKAQGIGARGGDEIQEKQALGRVAEWSIAPVLKTGNVARRSRVRIPPLPLERRQIPSESKS
jgi:hypothetical protein